MKYALTSVKNNQFLLNLKKLRIRRKNLLISNLVLIFKIRHYEPTLESLKRRVQVFSTVKNSGRKVMVLFSRFKFFCCSRTT